MCCSRPFSDKQKCPVPRKSARVCCRLFAPSLHSQRKAPRMLMRPALPIALTVIQRTANDFPDLEVPPHNWPAHRRQSTAAEYSVLLDIFGISSSIRACACRNIDVYECTPYVLRIACHIRRNYRRSSELRCSNTKYSGVTSSVKLQNTSSDSASLAAILQDIHVAHIRRPTRAQAPWLTKCGGNRRCFLSYLIICATRHLPSTKRYSR